MKLKLKKLNLVYKLIIIYFFLKNINILVIECNPIISPIFDWKKYIEIRKNDLNYLKNNLILDDINEISNIIEEFNKKHQNFIREIFKHCSNIINGISVQYFDPIDNILKPKSMK